MTEKEFNIIWTKFVEKKYNSMAAQYGGLYFDTSLENETYLHYQELNEYTKRHYMKSSENYTSEKINRYKIAACVMIALLKTKPIKKVCARYYTERYEQRLWTFNESMAFYVGSSIIREFFVEDIMQCSDNSDEDISIYKALYLDHIPLTQKDRKRWEVELLYLRLEGFSNVLSLAHQLEDQFRIKYLEKKIAILES